MAQIILKQIVFSIRKHLMKLFAATFKVILQKLNLPMDFFEIFSESSLLSTVSKNIIKMIGHHSHLRDMMGQSYPIYLSIHVTFSYNLLSLIISIGDMVAYRVGIGRDSDHLRTEIGRNPSFANVRNKPLFPSSLVKW